MNPLNKKIILGTVQLGLPYGINNQNGQPSEAEAFSILDLAWKSNIHTLDTAQAYGNSQAVIKKFSTRNSEKSFQILTKFKVENTSLSAQLDKTLQELGINNLYSYSYHYFKDTEDKRVREELSNFKRQGMIKKVGVSIYDQQEFEAAIEMDHIDIIQTPFNLLDNWQQKGSSLQKAKNRGKEIHVRSVFLQGLFFTPAEKISPKLKPLSPHLLTIQEIARKYHASIQSLALQYALSFSEIDQVLIGVESKTQLEDNLTALGQILPPEFIEEVSKIRVNDIHLLDPRKWNENT